MESFIKGLGDGDLSFTELNLEGFNIRPESGACIGKLISLPIDAPIAYR